MEKYWALSNINVYSILCPPKVKDYAKQNGNQYGKGDIIYTQYKTDKKVYLVSNGKVKLVNYDAEGNEIVKQILTKGEVFGESVILGQTERNEYAVSCSSKTSICSMSLISMRELMRDNERFSTAVYKFIGLRFKKIERRLELLLGKDVTARIASFIYDLHEEAGKKHFSHPFSQKDIAVLLATSRESVAKVMNRMKDENVIDYNRNEIIIKNLNNLLEMSKA